jgi:hypothetical protein
MAMTNGFARICVSSTPTSRESRMKHIVVLTTVALSACSTVTPSKTATPTQPPAAAASAQPTVPTQAAAPAPEQAAPVAGVAPAISGLSDLEAITFRCSKAGLNAAAREAAKAPGQGQYQFSYFKIISDSHHSVYEVQFKSNHHGDKDLKYCVSVYCQQGWDPTTSKTSVNLMSDSAPGKAGAASAHGAHCVGHMQPVKPRAKR